jgi:hypothetical protein
LFLMASNCSTKSSILTTTSSITSRTWFSNYILHIKRHVFLCGCLCSGWMNFELSIRWTLLSIKCAQFCINRDFRQILSGLSTVFLIHISLSQWML